VKTVPDIAVFRKKVEVFIVSDFSFDFISFVSNELGCWARNLLRFFEKLVDNTWALW